MAAPLRSVPDGVERAVLGRGARAVHGRGASASDPDDDLDEDTYALADDQIDLEQPIRDLVGVEMPFAPLCRPDCMGLCETCGGNRNLGECPGHEMRDPRFAVLADLLPDLPDTND